ncbi:triosephosphate isomerase (TIM) [Enteropsectra breve]|nr:triosephosphate isomerase (TIM) [Enteropsectra breve]
MKLVVGNWKMGCDGRTFKNLKGLDKMHLRNCEIVVAIPNIYIGNPKFAVPSGIKIAAQNVSAFENVAHTGDTSASMLIENKVEYVLLGHSECRKYFGDTNASIGEKLKNSIGAGLKAILCVGEPKECRETSTHKEFLCAEFDQIFKGNRDIILDIAYEPEWAIGSGETPTKQQLTEVFALFFTLRERYGLQGRLLYGGSVSCENAAEFMAIKHVDGLLIGGAALSSEFLKICEAVDQS